VCVCVCVRARAYASTHTEKTPLSHCRQLAYTAVNLDGKANNVGKRSLAALIADIHNQTLMLGLNVAAPNLSCHYDDLCARSYDNRYDDLCVRGVPYSPTPDLLRLTYGPGRGLQGLGCGKYGMRVHVMCVTITWFHSTPRDGMCDLNPKP
jgi:hypothetical protein